MLVPVRPCFTPGLLIAATVPIAVFLGCLALPAMVHGYDGLQQVVEAAGPFAALVALALLVELPLLSVVLACTGAGRAVPLAVLLGLAMLPWALGLVGTEVLVDRVQATLPHLDAAHAGLALTTGTGLAMAPRLLGTWTSAVLLLAVAVGLVLARFVPAGVGGGAREHPRAHSLLLASGLATVLAAMALVGTFEARHLFDLLTELARVPEALRAELAARSMVEAQRLSMARWALTAVLVVPVLLLARRSPGEGAGVSSWMARLVPSAALAALLVLDAHPLHSSSGEATLGVPAGDEAAPRGLDMRRLLGEEAPPQSIEYSITRASTVATPKTTSITTPSDRRTTGGSTSFGSGLPYASGDGAGGTSTTSPGSVGSDGRWPPGASEPASASSSPSRASDSTLWM